MKKVLSVIMLAFVIGITTSNLVASEVSNAQRALDAAQKELSKEIEKRDKLVTQISDLQANYEEEAAKMEEHKDKPKSLAYKNAAKKCESLKDKIAQKNQALEQIKSDIEALYNKVSDCQIALDDAQSVEALETQPIIERSTDPEEVLTTEETKPTESKSTKNKVEKSSSASTSTKQVSPAPAVQNKTKKEDSKDDKDTPTWAIVLIVLFFVLYIWFRFKRKHHCPECGKWFTMHYEGDKNIRGHELGKHIGRRSTYRCNNCGHVTRIITWTK